MSDFTIGIDVSKDHLDIHRLPDGATCRVANSPDGLAELGGLDRRSARRPPR